MAALSEVWAKINRPDRRALPYSYEEGEMVLRLVEEVLKKEKKDVVASRVKTFAGSGDVELYEIVSDMLRDRKIGTCENPLILGLPVKEEGMVLI